MGDIGGKRVIFLYFVTRRGQKGDIAKHGSPKRATPPAPKRVKKYPSPSAIARLRRPLNIRHDSLKKKGFIWQGNRGYYFCHHTNNLWIKHNPLYPLLFDAQFYSKLWGGARIAAWFAGSPRGEQGIGELFSLSGLEGQCSTISNGPLQGQGINALIPLYKEALLGQHVYQSHPMHFPLLVKIIDAAKDLSIQVHPDDELAQSLGLPYGKHEMWYILETHGTAKITAGFREACDTTQLTHYIQNNQLTEHLQASVAHQGDSFDIPAGRIHTIGAGNTLVEVQQSSNTTYRIYDYDRRDAAGQPRELHLDMAMKALNFADSDHGKIPPSEDKCLLASPHFTVNKQAYPASTTLDYAALDSFVILFNLGDTFVLEHDTHRTSIAPMQTVLLPACLHHIQLQTQATFLEIHC